MENVNVKMSYKKYLEKVYLNLQFPYSFAGVEKLYRTVRKDRKFVLGKAKIRKWLETEGTFGLHRQINRKLRRRKVIAPYINYQWDADTAVMKSCNAWYGYFLLAIDVVSRFVHTCPLKTTHGKETALALQTFFLTEDRQKHGVPVKRRATSLEGRESRPLLHAKRTEEFVRERAIETIKSKLSRYISRHHTHRWIEVLDSITQIYNRRYHRSINETQLWKLQYGPKNYATIRTRRFAFKKGDTVCISHVRQPFDREYDERLPWNTSWRPTAESRRESRTTR